MEKIPLSQIKADPGQPRQSFDPEDLEVLMKSIASQGIINPLVVEKTSDGKYLLIDGERRFRASTQLGLKTVPCEVLPAMSDVERFVKRFHLQEMHKSWTLYDKAVAIKQMIDGQHMNAKDISEALGLKGDHVARLLSFLDMSDRTRKAFGENRIPFSYLVQINKVLKIVDNIKERRAVEDALVDKISSGVVQKASQLLYYKRAILSKDGPKFLKKVITVKDYSPKEALEESGSGVQARLTAVSSYSRYIATTLKALLDAGDGKYLEREQVSSIKFATGKLEALLKQARVDA